MYKLDLEKTDDPEIKCQHMQDHRKIKGIKKISWTSDSLTMLKLLTVWITTNWNILRDWNTRPRYLPSEKQDKKEQLELDMEKWTGSKLGEDYIKAVYCHLAYLTYIQTTSYKMLGWVTHKLESRLWEKYQQPQICIWYHSNGRKWRGTEEPLN